ncbi:MAG: VTT domain-containing protein [Balneolaceae bacterium]
MKKHSGFFSRTWIWFLAAYLLSLALSWCVTAALGRPDLTHKNQKVIVSGSDSDKRSVSYYHLKPGDPSSVPVIILHDIIYSAEALFPLAEKISEHNYEVIIPEYPGYGFSDQNGGFRLKDKAESVGRVIEELDLDAFHLAALGDGAGVAFYLAAKTGYKPESLVLLSSSGVQELKLLGNHTLNRTLYLLQFPVYWFFDYLTPHFGLLNQFHFNYSAVRSLYDMDQRPVREMMRQFNKPVYIIHGFDDRYIGRKNAVENHRLLPHSDIDILSGNHLLFIEKDSVLSKRISRFLGKVEASAAATRSEASSERIRKSRAPFVPDQVSMFTGLSLLVVLILLALLTVASEDLACIGAGLLVAKGFLDFVPAAAACFFGILVADITIYWLGRWVGSPMLGRMPFRWFIRARDVRKAENLFKQNGLMIIFVSRFLPGTRFPTYFSAGMVRTRFSLFLLYFLLSILLWTPLLVGLSMFIGQNFLDVYTLYQDYAVWVFIGLLLTIFISLKVIMPVFTMSGRKSAGMRIDQIKKRLF